MAAVRREDGTADFAHLILISQELTPGAEIPEPEGAVVAAPVEDPAAIPPEREAAPEISPPLVRAPKVNAVRVPRIAPKPIRRLARRRAIRKLAWRLRVTE